MEGGRICISISGHRNWKPISVLGLRVGGGIMNVDKDTSDEWICRKGGGLSSAIATGEVSVLESPEKDIISPAISYSFE
jgi:hypothetical protein